MARPILSSASEKPSQPALGPCASKFYNVGKESQGKGVIF